jgi:Amt family ammonium transporter
VLVAAGYAFVVTFGLAWLVRATMGFRIDPEVEAEGIDEAEHAESAYEFSPLTTPGRGHGAAVPPGDAGGEREMMLGLSQRSP